MIFLELFWTFFKLGALTFGGGYAMIPILTDEVLAHGWLTSEQILNFIAVAESTPGPIAINMATYIGYKKAGILGATAATLGMVLPSFLILLAISLFFENFLAFPLVAKAFRGIRVAVALLILRAGWKMAGKMLKNTKTKVSSLVFVVFFFAVSLCLSLFNIRLSTIWLILFAGVTGFCLYGRKEAQK